MHPLSLPFRPLFPIPASSPWIPRSARALAPSCQEIFVTESRVVSLGEQATPKVSRLSGPAAPSIRATIIGQLKPGESVRVTCHPIIIRCPRGGSTTYPRDRVWVAETNSRERGRESERAGEEQGWNSNRRTDAGGKVPTEGRKAEDGIDYSDHVDPDSTTTVVLPVYLSPSLFLCGLPLLDATSLPLPSRHPAPRPPRLSSRSLAYHPPPRKSMRTARPFLNPATHDWSTPWCHV